MDLQAIKLIIMIISVLLIGSSAVMIHLSYRRYHNRMTRHHLDEWRKLMSRDPLIQAAGGWIRWPIGSIYIFTSVFSFRECYHDDLITVYKKRIVISSIVFAVSFVLFLTIATTLPR